MQVAMNDAATRRNFFAFLTNPNFTPREVVEPDFDEDPNHKPLTAEHLDWEFTRHWPVLATD